MIRGNRLTSNRPSTYRRLLGALDDNPLTGVANLFDGAIILAVAFLLTLVTSYSIPELLSKRNEVALMKDTSPSKMELIKDKKEAIRLEKYRMTQKTIGGEGVKLGTAYRLKTGEVLCVPEPGLEESGETGQGNQK
jgi:hypothetical protein